MEERDEINAGGSCHEQHRGRSTPFLDVDGDLGDDEETFPVEVLPGYALLCAPFATLGASLAKQHIILRREMLGPRGS